MLLYIHVPFCHSKCHYCTFASVPTQDRTPTIVKSIFEEYTVNVLHELELWGSYGAETLETACKIPPVSPASAVLVNQTRTAMPVVETIFFGGGTPSLLPAAHIARILEGINAHFTLASAVEVTIESNPESALKKNWLKEVRGAGVTRISLGVQSFDDATLGFLGRPHKADDVFAVWDAIQKCSFTSTNMDLMWGLPERKRGTSLELWGKTLDKALELAPDHLSCYGLMLEKNSPFDHKCTQTPYALPDEKAECAMYFTCLDMLKAKGLYQYEIANFAQKGHKCQHNLGYWAGKSYLGLGPAAVSCFGSMRWENPRDINTWQNRTLRTRALKNKKLHNKGLKNKALQKTQNILIPANYEERSVSVQLQEFIMLALRTVKGVDAKKWQEIAGQNLFEQYAPLLKDLVKADLGVVERDAFRLTPRGLLLSNAIIERFFECLA